MDHWLPGTYVSVLAPDKDVFRAQIVRYSGNEKYLVDVKLDGSIKRMFVAPRAMMLASDQSTPLREGHMPEIIKQRDNAWDDLILALPLLQKHCTDTVSPFHCEHDELMIMSDPSKYERHEIKQLDEWGFHCHWLTKDGDQPEDDEMAPEDRDDLVPDPDQGFYSFRYGSA